MKYYKLVLDNKIIGAINSNNFVRYSLVALQFTAANEETGEYIEYKGLTYRSSWLRPIVYLIPYISVFILEITKEEYDSFAEAIVKNLIIYDNTVRKTEPLTQYTDPIETASIEFIRSSKINEMSYACHQTIEAGLDIELRGETHHFSLDTQDLLNLMTLSTLAQTLELIPYHADGEECIFYTADEIKIIVDKTTSFKIYHTTYYNALKTYINALETIEEISAIIYGTPIPEEYKSDVLKTLENQMK